MQKTQILHVGSKSERHASAVSGSDFYLKSVNVGSFTLFVHACVCKIFGLRHTFGWKYNNCQQKLLILKNVQNLN